MNYIKRYFPELAAAQLEQFATLLRLYPEWNEKINVISRKDIDNLELNHIVHSLAIAKMIQFTPGTRVMDLGTGGGLPGLPLAVYFPQVHFHLVDRIGKKLKVVSDIAREAGLDNVTVQHGDALEVKEKFHFVVSRAVMPLPHMVKPARKVMAKEQINSMPNGLICLKGGNLKAEIEPFGRKVIVDDLHNYFAEPFFETKKLVYLPL